MCSCVAQCLLYVVVMIIEKGLMTALLLLDFWSHVRVLFRRTFLYTHQHQPVTVIFFLFAGARPHSVTDSRPQLGNRDCDVCCAFRCQRK